MSGVARDCARRMRDEICRRSIVIGGLERKTKMSLGLVGRKIGMTRIFTDDGKAVPVTVLDVANNRVTQIKTPETDGYSAVQVTYGKRRASRVSKPQAGHLAKAGVEAGEVLREFPVAPEALAKLKVGETIGAATFAVGELVDVTGTTKGRGFTGVITRHHFSSNRASHGNSRSHNTPGSIGMAQDPGRVFPGKRMAGQHGNATRTVQTLTVIRVDAERGLLLVKGCVPGADGGHIVVRPSAKTPAKKGA
jgi:large subunit ribosomal protein L3